MAEAELGAAVCSSCIPIVLIFSESLKGLMLRVVQK